MSTRASTTTRVLLVENATGHGRTAGKSKLAFVGTAMAQLHDAVAVLLQLQPRAHALRLETWDSDFGEWVNVVSVGELPLRAKLQVHLAH